MTDNIQIIEKEGISFAQVVLGDKKIRARKLIADNEEVICLELFDETDTGNEKLKVQLIFKNLESVLIMQEWLHGISDTFEKIRTKQMI